MPQISPFTNIRGINAVAAWPLSFPSAASAAALEGMDVDGSQYPADRAEVGGRAESHVKGAPSHPSTKEGLESTIRDPELRSKVEKEKILTGKTTAIGKDGVVVGAGSGGAAAGLKELEEEARRLGAKVEDIPGMPGGKKYVDPKTGQSGSFRPQSTKEGRVTVETTYNGPNGEKFTVKRRH